MSCFVAYFKLLAEDKTKREEFCSLNIILFHNSLYDLESTELKLLINHFHNGSKVKRSLKRKRRRGNERERERDKNKDAQVSPVEGRVEFCSSDMDRLKVLFVFIMFERRMSYKILKVAHSYFVYTFFLIQILRLLQN